MDRRIPPVIVAVLIIGLVTAVFVVAANPEPQSTNPSLPPTGTTHPTAPPPEWSQYNTTGSPATNASMMAFLPTSNELLLVDSGGGCTSSSTWALTGTTWQNLTTQVGPGPKPARAFGGMAYDSDDGYMVLFGGASPCGTYNDTWEFANNAWSRVATTSAPPPLYGFAMTYDASDGYVLLTGGCCIAGRDSNQTWAFVHGAWTNLTAGPSPVVDRYGAMAYDAALTDVVYVDGYSSGFVSQATWVFHAGNWTRLYPIVSPSNRAGMGLVYDAALSKVVLVGGYAKVTTGVWINLTDTWTYGGGPWDNLTAGLDTSPPFVSGAALMTYDPGIQRIVLFLGHDQTWVFGSTALL
ncbi:MAG: kelch repeat-containing protein [Thermoplasmata archaeon]